MALTNLPRCSHAPPCMTPPSSPYTSSHAPQPQAHAGNNAEEYRRRWESPVPAIASPPPSPDGPIATFYSIPSSPPSRPSLSPTFPACRTPSRSAHTAPAPAPSSRMQAARAQGDTVALCACAPRPRALPCLHPLPPRCIPTLLAFSTLVHTPRTRTQPAPVPLSSALLNDIAGGENEPGRRASVAAARLWLAPEPS
ncbi:hypothetical protein B0H16DRAFT_1900574 [Mycena metata]|uniref:Uncharacterized protein n=1 Tax=Mycena metata TaxID=1033252 RepID=A0AAD7H480_9AGAR|nr:hypothetical protein B0H16DRAFT_1900574 [Mycena metata]